jgi:polysaccharide biosynthesis transport protein
VKAAVIKMNSGLDFRSYALMARRRFLYFILPFLAVLGIGSIVTLLLPKMFNSSAKILVESQQIPDNFVKATVTALAAERLEVLKQRVLTRENLLNLITKFNMFENRKDLSKSDLVDLMRERISFNSLDITLNAGGKTAAPVRGNNRLAVAFAVGFNSESPTVAAKVANELVTIVLEEDVRNRTSAASETTKFLSRESERLVGELAKMEAVISDFKQKNSEMLPERLQFNMTALDRQSREIEDINRIVASSDEQKRMIELEAKIRQSANGQVPGTVISNNDLAQQLAKLRLTYAANSAVYNESYPAMRTLRTQIAILQKQVEQANTSQQDQKPNELKDSNLNADMQLTAQKIRAIDSSVADAKKRLDILSKSVEVLKKNIQGTPAVSASLESLERKRVTLQTNVDDIQTKLDQAKLGERLEQDQQAERFSVIESPVIPTTPVSPKRLQLAMLFLGLGVGAGGVSAVGAQLIDSTIRHGRDITKKLPRINMLGNIPYILTKNETRASKTKYFVYFLVGIVCLGAILAVIHFFVTPLDLLVYSARAALKI